MNETILRVLETEKRAIEIMAESLDEAEINDVLKAMKNRKGKIIFLGVGKSGHIGEKLAATFSSLGTSSFYVHGTEACHGDLGMIEKRDIVILFISL